MILRFHHFLTLGKILSKLKSVDSKYICSAHEIISSVFKKVKTMWGFNDVSANYCLTHNKLAYELYIVVIGCF